MQLVIHAQTIISALLNIVILHLAKKQAFVLIVRRMLIVHLELAGYLQMALAIACQHVSMLLLLAKMMDNVVMICAKSNRDQLKAFAKPQLVLILMKLAQQLLIVVQVLLYIIALKVVLIRMEMMLIAVQQLILLLIIFV